MEPKDLYLSYRQLLAKVASDLSIRVPDGYLLAPITKENIEDTAKLAEQIRLSVLMLMEDSNEFD